MRAGQRLTITPWPRKAVAGFNGGSGGMLRRPAERFQFSDLRGLLPPHGMPKIPVLLQPKPEVRGSSENLPESERGVRCDRMLSSDDLVQPREGDPESYRKGGLADPQRLQEFLQTLYCPLRSPRRRSSRLPGGTASSASSRTRLI